MSIFSHRAPPLIGRYPQFKTAISEDFHDCCAYCLLPKTLAGRAFELDHHRPKGLAQFAHLIHDYNNIYYSCRQCNLSKGSKWPTPDEVEEGWRFIDTCAEDFSAHFDALPSGEWRPKTPAGKYTADVLGFNDPELVRVRTLIEALLQHSEAPPIDWDSPLREQVAELSFWLDPVTS